MYKNVTILCVALVLTSCGALQEMADQLTKSGKCSSFNGDRDGFSMSISPDQIALDVGESFDLKINASWYNLDMDREQVNCTPDWTSNPSGALNVNEKTVVANFSGVHQLIATVTGSGGTKTEKVWVLAAPSINEQESNNGIAFAQNISAGQQIYGRLNDSADIDVFKASIPAGGSYEFKLVPAVTVTNDDPFYAPSYYGDLINSSNGYLGEPNRAYTNTTGSALTVYLEVDGSVNHDIPYRVELIQK